MQWPDSVDEILAGDQAVVLAYRTPAGGVVCAPVTNFGQRDRVRGVITVNSSVGMPRKLQRIRSSPPVALAFHTRQHSSSERQNFALVQGTASLSDPVPDYPDSLGDDWDRFDGPRATGSFWKWWLRVYYTRVEIRISVDRIVTWSDLSCAGAPQVHGDPLPATGPESQRAPRKGTQPRLDHHAAAGKAAELPDVLLGWTDSDSHPAVAPVGIRGADASGIILTAPDGLLPRGSRRAGLTAHSFTRHVLGQNQRLHTGWLQVENGAARYMPHTSTGHRLPPSLLLYRLAVGFGTRRGSRT